MGKLIKKYIITVLLLAFTVFTTGCSSVQKEETGQPLTRKSVTVTVNRNKKIGRDIEKLLEEYGCIYGKVLTTLEKQDVSPVFIDDALRAVYEEKAEKYLNVFYQYPGIARQNRYKNQAALDTLAAIRGMSAKNLAAESVAVTYNVDSVTETEDMLIVHIREENQQKFSFMESPSYSANISHWFAFRNTVSGWKIAGHLQEEDFFLLALEAWEEDTAGATYTDKVADTVKILVADAQENIDKLAAEPGKDPADKDIEKEYNREAAVKYAEKWWNERNYTGNLAYDVFGGNCQNFASQCIHAGGMDMDHSGYIQHQWKFYDRKINERWMPAGRSYSWTGVDAFYSYAQYNTDGMLCRTDLKLKYAEKGDVIQVGAYHRWRHSLVVTDTLQDENGKMSDIVVASNTADRWNYPLSAYIYTYPRLIHIIGSN